MSLNGDDLNRIVLESGPAEAAEIVNREFGPALEKRISSYLRQKHCRNYVDHGPEVVNDMWICVIRDFTRFFDGKKASGYTYPLSWLMTVAVSCCNRHLTFDITRSCEQATETESDLERDSAAHIERARIYTRSVEKEYELKEARAALDAYIRELPLKARVVVQLYSDGMPQVQIARFLFLKEENVRQIISRTTRGLIQRGVK